MKTNNDLFKYLKNIKYKIKKDNNKNNIIYIDYDDKQIKCNYLLLFIEIKSNSGSNNILWSCDNPFVDNYTHKITKLIKENLESLQNFVSLDSTGIRSIDASRIPASNKIYEIIKYIQNEKYKKNSELIGINCEWILNNNYKEYVEYYMITRIIYF